MTQISIEPYHVLRICKSHIFFACSLALSLVIILSILIHRSCFVVFVFISSAGVRCACARKSLKWWLTLLRLWFNIRKCATHAISYSFCHLFVPQRQNKPLNRILCHKRLLLMLAFFCWVPSCIVGRRRLVSLRFFFFLSFVSFLLSHEVSRIKVSSIWCWMRKHWLHTKNAKQNGKEVIVSRLDKKAMMSIVWPHWLCMAVFVSFSPVIRAQRPLILPLKS